MYPWDKSTGLLYSSASPCWTPWRVGSMDDEQNSFLMASSLHTTETTGKRQRISSDENEHEKWDRYLVISGTDDRFKKISAIAVCKTLKQLIGQPEDARRMMDGSVLVKTGNKNQSQQLLRLAHMEGAEVRVQPHRTLNTCKGTIVSRESHKCTNEELNEWLNERNVVDIKRVPLRKEPLELLILTFHGNSLPSRVPVGFEWCKVRAYIPNPRRCFHCQKYGHVSRTCRGQPRCARCGKEDHVHTTENPCQLEPHCVNCGQEHPSYDRSCPTWNVEKEVQRLKIERDISFPQARRLAEQIRGPVTYKSVLTSSPKSRKTPQTRIELDPNHVYSKHNSQKNSKYNRSQSSPRGSTDRFDILLEKIAQRNAHSSDDDSNLDMETNTSLPVEVIEGNSSTALQKESLESSQENSASSLPKPAKSNIPRATTSSGGGSRGTTKTKILNRSSFQPK